jgi:hypothetical protein
MKRTLIALLTVAIIGGILFSGCVAPPPEASEPSPEEEPVAPPPAAPEEELVTSPELTPEETPIPKLVGQWKLEEPQGRRVGFGSGTIGKIGGKDYLFVWVISKDVEDTKGTSSKAGIMILDLQNPDNPTKVAYLEAPGATGWGVFELSDTVLYASAGSYLWVLDVSNPSVPRELSQLSSIYVSSMAICGKYAYMDIDYIVHDPNSIGKIFIADISDPAHLQVIGNSERLPGDLYNGLRGLTTSGSLLLALSEKALGIFDISSPPSLKMVGYFPNTDPGSYLYVPADPEHTVGVSARFFDIAIAGNYVYIAASGPAGMRVIDISNPSSPQQITNLETPRGVGRIFISGSLAYLTMGDSSTGPFYPITGMGLDIIDISHPDNPRELGSAVPSDYRLSKFIVANNRMYVFVDGLPGSSPFIEIIDLHPPSK